MINRKYKHIRSEVYRRFDIFGWIFYITRTPLSIRHRGKATRNAGHKALFKILDGKCQHCGHQMENFFDARYHTKLTAEHDSAVRWAPENTVMLCPKCNSGYQLAKERSHSHWSAIDIEKAIVNAGFNSDFSKTVFKELYKLDHDISKYYSRMAAPMPEAAEDKEGGVL